MKLIVRYMLTDIWGHPSDRHTLFQTWMIHMWLLFFRQAAVDWGYYVREIAMR